MIYLDLFTHFDTAGSLQYADQEIPFSGIPWSPHPAFEGVALKHMVTSEQTGGLFSYHLVRIAPNKSIGNHLHEKQLETHEVIAGTGTCLNNGVSVAYAPGRISILEKNTPHEVHAGAEGLYLFAKFMPPLL